MGTDKTDTLVAGMSHLSGRSQDGCTIFALEGNGSRPSHQGNGYSEEDVSYTLNSTEQHGVVYKKKGHPQNAEEGQGLEEAQVSDTLNIFDNSEQRTPHLVLEDMVARRLTPLECTRLQGFPDGWVDIGDWTDSKGKVHKDSDGVKYKALGNSIALPFWQWLADRIVARLKEDGVENPTMCSLFDGIGGFPLVFKRSGCEPIWASEIEEFPIAVTKHHFPEEGE